jgi:hypothetical protein
MGAYGIVVAPPAFDHNLSLLEGVEDFALEQFVPELTSVTPICRMASATVRACAVRTSACRSFATISAAVCLFLLLLSSSIRLKAIHQGGPLLRGQTTVHSPIGLR